MNRTKGMNPMDHTNHDTRVLTSIRLIRLAVATTVVMIAVGAHAAPTPTSTEAELIAILQGDGPEADKALACKFAAVNGSRAAVPAVAPLLRNPRLASWARIALEAIPGDEAAAALREATGTLDARLLTGVIASLGVRGDAAAVPLLAGKLAAEDAEVAAAAAWSLGRIATPEAGLLLAGALEKAASPARLDAVAEAAVLCAANLHAAGKGEEAVALCGVVRAADVSEQRRAEAIRGTIIAKGREGIPLLVETLASPTKRLANMAVFTARDLGRGDAADATLAAEVDSALLKAIDAASASNAVPRAVLLIDVLAERNAGGAREPVVAALTRMLSATNPKPLRLAAIEALGRAGDAAVVGPLLMAAADEDPGIADTARAAVASLPGEAVDREIVSRLAGADAKILPVLVELVGRRRIAAAAALLPLASHPEEKVRTATIVALGPTVDLANLDVLVAAATAPKSPAEGEAARTAVREASVRMPDRDGCAGKLAAALEKAPAEAKVMLLDVIGEVGGTKAVETMATVARSGDEALEDAATRLLGKWMTADAAPVLLGLATAEPGGKFKTRALRGYIRIARQFVLPDGERAEMCRKVLAAAQEDADRKAVLEILVRYPSAATLAVAEEAAKLPGLEGEAVKAANEIRAKVQPAKKAG
jgi:HEAT repeat protein